MVTLAAGQKVVVSTDTPLTAEPARWQLLENGSFDQGIKGWAWRYDQYGDNNSENAVYHLIQEMVDDQVVWAVELLRKGGTEDLCAAILSQEIEEDLSPYQSVWLDFDLNLKYQGLPGGGPRGEDYPFAVRIRYLDADGRSRQYLYGFYYYTSANNKITPNSGESIEVSNYRWEPIRLDLLAISPSLVRLSGIDLLASGQDYRSWFANVSLVATLANE